MRESGTGGAAFTRISWLHLNGGGEGGAAVRIQLLLEGEWILDDDAVAVIAPESMFGDWQAEIITRSRFPRYDYYEVPSDGDVPHASDGHTSSLRLGKP